VAGKNPSPKVNLFEDFTGRLDIAGAVGSAEIAMYLYEIEPGESLPYHYEYVDEWLLVVDGTVAVRVPDGDRELQRGDLVRYPDTDTIGVWPDGDTEYYFKLDTAVSRDVG
jgi:uncharacterized cupin superfamily protein